MELSKLLGDLEQKKDFYAHKMLLQLCSYRGQESHLIKANLKPNRDPFAGYGKKLPDRTTKKEKQRRHKKFQNHGITKVVK